MRGVAGCRFERRAAACVPDRQRKKERSWGTKDTHISSPIPPIIGERGGLGGEAEKSQRVHRDVVVLDGREVRDPCLPPMPPTSPSHLPSVQCPWCDGGVAQKMSTLGVGDWGMGGWGMEDLTFPFVDQRLDRWPKGWATCSAWVGYDERDMSRRFLTPRMGWGRGQRWIRPALSSFWSCPCVRVYCAR